MPPELTPAEQAFFETGILSPELTAPESVPDSPPASTPAPTPAPIPALTPAPTPEAELREQLLAERVSLTQLTARVSQLAEQLGKPPAPAPAPAPVEPNAATDPLGAMLHKLNTVTETVATLQQNLTQQQQQAGATQQFTEFTNNLRAVRDEFTKQTPDFPAAYQHLRTARADDLRDVGVPEAEIARALLQDEMAVAHNAITQGKNPAQVIYNMAKRYGYAAKPAAAAPATPAEKLAQLAAGTASAVAPPTAGGTSQLTFDGLKDASDVDLNKMVADDALWAKLVGNSTTDIF